MVKEDGWIGPEEDGPGGGHRLIWARSLIFFKLGGRQQNMGTANRGRHA
jgi:hypothetical protein